MLLEQEEQEVLDRRKKIEEKETKHLEQKATELEKQRERERARCDKRPKWKREEEEEKPPMIDDEDKDADYDPEQDPEAQFITEDQNIENEDTFEVEKHVHAVNIVEAGDYLIAMNRYMEAFTKIVQWGKGDVLKQYKKLIHFIKLMIEKHGAYSLIETADVEAVYDTVVDPQCIAW